MTSPSPTTALSASDFDASIGICLDQDLYMNGTSSYYSTWKQLLLNAGIEHVRMSFGNPGADAIIEDLAASGVHVMVGVQQGSNTSPDWYENYLVSHPQLAAAITEIEGPNEVNGNNGSDWASYAQTFMQQLYTDIKSNPITAHIQVVAPNVNNAFDTSLFQQLGNMSSYTDMGDVHGAAWNGAPAFPQTTIANEDLVTPGKPLLNSEGGYSTASTPNPGNGQYNPTEHAAAIMDLQYYLNDFKAGIVSSDLYDFWDYAAGGTDYEGSFGILHNDYSPKASYNAITAMTTLLKDTGTGSFTPGQLSYSLDGADANTQTMLLEKHDGSFWLAVWENEPVWDGTNNKEINTQSTSVTLHLASAASGAIYDPVDNGTTAVSSFSNTSTVSFNASTTPTLIEISPGNGSGDPSSGSSGSSPAGGSTPIGGSGSSSSSGSGSETLTLHVSGDMYNGDPDIQVTVDGQQVGTYDITAHHSQGDSQTITITGDWDPTTAHQVQIQYGNDAWDGTGMTDGHDRNVYVSDISMNGHDIAGSSGTNNATNGALTSGNANEAAMDINGTLAFNVPADPPSGSTGNSGSTGDSGSSSTGGDPSSGSGSSTLTLHVSGDMYNGDPDIQVTVDGQQVGTYDITAHHSQGDSQTITITGDWDPTTAHQVQIQYGNDAWDGTGMTDGHDRNVYVSDISMNGHDIAGSSGTNNATNGALTSGNANEAAMDINGTLAFNVPAESSTTGQGSSAPLVNPAFSDGAGNDVFMFSAMSQSGGQIANFTNHDILDLAPLLKSLGYTGTDPIGDHVVTLLQSGSDSTAVMVDPTGHDPHHGTTLVTLDHVLPQNVAASAVWH